ncbi:hypothetical protein FB566_1018 [Stackebrandtia endophytica]|uniref:Uncharacterized protein n=1 Tax=Stackebrandtia endophytica TaxID=1496996 RepID=A0A543ASG0_9ACTN|nr:hypothetical protein [Stackebrandtia endophytica]TQL75512.1 hypothetical protein FB566_1018 [Stackebrandtia endophytica]
MRKSGPRGSRAKRRQFPRNIEPPPAPEAWPDPETLRDALQVNEVAQRLLTDMRPETVRTILKRMDTPTRKAVFEPHNIPVTKVGLRSAGQVLTLLRADDTPAENPMLGTMLSPAADLFHHAVIGDSEITGLRLKLVDLALSLLEHNDSVINGLRTWHRWAEDEFEDLTLAVVIGLKCSHATVAAAYLAGSHADVAERYQALRNDYPRMPDILSGRVTTTNPVTRYLAARPDRKTPANPAELRAMLAEDSRVRRSEVGQAQRERDRDRNQQHREPPPVDGPEPDESPVEPAHHSPPETAPVSDPVTAPPIRPPNSSPIAPTAAALPTVADWASAVVASRRMTERLVAGEPPSPGDLAPLYQIFDQLERMSELLTLVLGSEVAPSRSSIDSSLTLVLSDPGLTETLGGLPATHQDVLERLERLRDNKAPDPPEEPGEEAAVPEPPEEPVDLSDLDAMLRGEAGSRLAALANPAESPSSDSDEDTESTPATAAASVPPQRTASDDPHQTTIGAKGAELIAIGLYLRTPQGELAQRFRELTAEVDADSSTENLIAHCAAMPVSLIDPAAGGVPLLSGSGGELAHHPAIAAFRDSIAELCRQGVQPHDPALIRLADLTANLHQTGQTAREILETAETRTLKYDKATKVYRHWLSPGGTLRPLLDALREGAPITEIHQLAEECTKVGAARAIDDTAALLIDPNRTKIVAGARKTLTDKFTEVLDLATVAKSISDEIEDESRIDRAAVWRFDLLSRFRERAHASMRDIEAELSQLRVPAEPVAALVLRALSLAVAPDPLHGPELSIQDALRRVTAGGRQ